MGIEDVDTLRLTLGRVEQRLRAATGNADRPSPNAQADVAYGLDDDDIDLMRRLLSFAQGNERSPVADTSTSRKRPREERTLFRTEEDTFGSVPKRRRVHPAVGAASAPSTSPPTTNTVTGAARSALAHSSSHLPRALTELEARERLEDLRAELDILMDAFQFPDVAEFLFDSDGFDVEDGRPNPDSPAMVAVRAHEVTLVNVMQEALCILCGGFSMATVQLQQDVARAISAAREDLHAAVQDAVAMYIDGLRGLTPSPSSLERDLDDDEFLRSLPYYNTGGTDHLSALNEQEAHAREEEVYKSRRRTRSRLRAEGSVTHTGIQQEQEVRAMPDSRSRNSASKTPLQLAGVGADDLGAHADGHDAKNRALAVGQKDPSQPHRLRDGPTATSQRCRNFLALLANMASPSIYGELSSALAFELGTDAPTGKDGAALPKLTCEPTVEAVGASVKNLKEYEARAWIAKMHSSLSELCFAWSIEGMYVQMVQDMVDRGEIETTDNVPRKNIMSALYEQLSAKLHIPEKKLQEWRRKGMRWAWLLYCGSVPAFLAVNLMDLKNDFMDGLDVDSLAEVGCMLRNPTDYKDPETTTGFVLPTIMHWGRCFNLKVGGRVFGVDLKEDDALISETFDFGMKRPPPRGSEWDDWDSTSQCTLFEPLPEELKHRPRPTPLAWTAPPAPGGTHIVTLALDPIDKPNLPFKKGDKAGRMKFTREQREIALRNQVRCDTLEELKEKAKAHVVEKDGPYLVIRGNFAKEMNFAAMIISPSVLPLAEMDALRTFVQDATLINPESVPTSSEFKKYRFPALHLVWTNRYSEKGDDLTTDPDAAPCMDRLDGNDKQRLLRLHRDARADLLAWRTTATGLEKVFALITARLKEHLPEQYEILLNFVETIPCGSWSPCAPFGGMVLNYGVSCESHVDDDLALCVVIIFGEFEGGELGLYEARVLLELKGMSIFVFCSDKLTHFNCPFQGSRGSIALSTEKASVAWVNFRNGWKSYMADRKRRLRKGKGKASK
ncbi:hypothetical protein EXIGLDRAFT_754177 [Exidia glandulosa HHB12029]|uniref:Uncharacterized protein n=1 Tax=Exidia glandulosa HHB12029 TaxID=1314781 RepID=A0A165D5G3_EXIGL|nr:hypothetical protein EXIGLDRAFT_754177 [Exidia glandulosa HHB12029]